MSHKNVMISIDEKIHKLAKDAQMEISAVAENAIKEKLNFKEIQIKEQCEFCGRSERKATAKNTIGMTWLCPDEKWICNSCLQSKMHYASTAG